MKVSEIQVTDVIEYLRTDAEDAPLISQLKNIAVSYIRSYTGMTDLQLDAHEDLVIVVYILCQDMFDNRVLYVEKSNLNRTVSTILDMHSRNLLPTPEEVV